MASLLDLIGYLFWPPQVPAPIQNPNQALRPWRAERDLPFTLEEPKPYPMLIPPGDVPLRDVMPPQMALEEFGRGGDLTTNQDVPFTGELFGPFATPGLPGMLGKDPSTGQWNYFPSFEYQDYLDKKYPPQDYPRALDTLEPSPNFNLPLILELLRSLPRSI